jgi:hypothetical protein
MQMKRLDIEERTISLEPSYEVTDAVHGNMISVQVGHDQVLSIHVEVNRRNWQNKVS